MLARRNLGEGGSIARRSPPGRNRRRASRAVDSLAVAKWILSRRDAEFAEKKKKDDCLLCALSAKSGLGGLRSGSPPCASCAHALSPCLQSFFRPFRPYPSLPWPLPTYPPVHQALVLSSGDQSTAIAMCITFQQSTLFLSFSTLFPNHCHRGATPNPLRQSHLQPKQPPRH